MLKIGTAVYIFLQSLLPLKNAVYIFKSVLNWQILPLENNDEFATKFWESRIFRKVVELSPGLTDRTILYVDQNALKMTPADTRLALSTERWHSVE